MDPDKAESGYPDSRISDTYCIRKGDGVKLTRNVERVGLDALLHLCSLPLHKLSIRSAIILSYTFSSYLERKSQKDEIMLSTGSHTKHQAVDQHLELISRLWLQIQQLQRQTKEQAEEIERLNGLVEGDGVDVDMDASVNGARNERRVLAILPDRRVNKRRAEGFDEMEVCGGDVFKRRKGEDRDECRVGWGSRW